MKTQIHSKILATTAAVMIGIATTGGAALARGGGGFGVSTNAFAAGGGGPAGGQASAIAGRASMGAVSRGGVGLSAGSPMPFIPLITPSNGGALPIGQGLGGGAGSPRPFLTLTPRSISSVPLSTGASSLFSTPVNSSQPAAPQANISSNAAPSQSGQDGTPNQGTVISVAGGGTQWLKPAVISPAL
jgi:hypothetical protein